MDDHPPRDGYGKVARHYGPTPLSRAEERAVLQLLPRDLRGRSVLDVGCGRGRYLDWARRRGASELVGVDLTREMLREAREGGFSDLVQGRVSALPLRNQVADVTVCALVLGHVEDLPAALTELARVTRVAGLVLCSELHPVGREQGWVRSFESGRESVTVTSTIHRAKDWMGAAQRGGLSLLESRDAYLGPGDLDAEPPPAALDPAQPVALALAFRKMDPHAE